MENMEITRGQINKTKTYIDLYKWLSRTISSSEWNDVYVPYFKSKAGYHDILNTYVGFMKEFEKATAKTGIDFSKRDFSEQEIAKVHESIGKMGEKGNIGKINMLLGRTFGKSAGRYYALLEALTLEAKIDKKEREIESLIKTNSSLKAMNNGASNYDVSAQVAELSALYAQLKNDISEVEGQLKTSGEKTTKAINASKEAIMNQIAGLYRRADTFDSTVNARFDEVSGLVRNAEHGIGHGIGVNIAETRNVGRKVDEVAGLVRNAEHGIGHGIGVSIAETRNVGRKVDDLGAKIDSKSKLNAKKIGAGVLAGAMLFGTGVGIGSYIANHANDNSNYVVIINSYENRIAELEQQLAGVRTQEEYDKLQSDLNKVQKAYDDYKEKHAISNEEVNSQLGALTSQINDLNSQIKDLNEQIKGLGDPSVIAGLQAQVKQLTSEKEALKKEYDDYKKNHTFSDTEYQAKLDKITELEQKLANSKSTEEYNKLQAELDSAKQELANYKSTHIYSNSEYQTKLDKITELEETLKNAYKNGVSQEEYDKIVDALSVAQKEFADYKVSHKYTNEEYNAKANKVAELEQKLANSKTQEEYNKLQSELNKAQKDLDNYKKSHTYANDEVEKMKADYQAEIVELKDELSKCKTEEEYNAAVAKYENFIDELYHSLTYSSAMSHDEAMDYISNIFGFNYEENTNGSEMDSAQRGA